MGCFWSDFRNEDFVKGLQRELNTDVVLFGINGFIYFGNLQAVHDNRTAILSPATKSDSTAVEIFTPGGTKLETPFLRLDLWSLAGRGTGIVSDPLTASAPTPTPAAAFENTRMEADSLTCLINRMIGDTISVTTLGGFTFSGTLNSMCNDLAIISIESIYGPGSADAITDASIRSVIVNLRTITSVSGTLTTT